MDLIEIIQEELKERGFFEDKQSVQRLNDRQLIWFDQESCQHGLFLRGDSERGTLYYTFMQQHLWSMSLHFGMDEIINHLRQITQTTGRDFLIKLMSTGL